MSQKELADRLFVTVATISNYEHGVHFPDVEKLVALADFFDVTTDYLLGRATSNLSPDILEEPLIADKTTGVVIQEIKNLNVERKKAIAVILNDMKVSMIIGELGR